MDATKQRERTGEDAEAVFGDECEMLEELERAKRAWCLIPTPARLRIATACRDAVEAVGKRWPLSDSERELRCALEMIAGRSDVFEDPKCKDPAGLARDTLDDWEDWRLG